MKNLVNQRRKGKYLVIPLLDDPSILKDGQEVTFIKTFNWWSFRIYCDYGIYHKDLNIVQVSGTSRSMDKLIPVDKLLIIDPLLNDKGLELSNFVLNFNPSQVNELDLKELHDIVFETADDNTQSDEIWEKLINWFDERGLSS